MIVQGLRLKTRQRGIAMAELAIALPLLLLLLLAIGEVGRLLFRDASRFVAGQAWNRTLGRLEITAALQDQARSLAVYGVPTAPADGRPLVPGLSPDHVAVSVQGTDHVQVSITYPFLPVFGNGLPNLGNGETPLAFSLVATSVMRAL